MHSLLASGGSIYNLYADDDEETEASPSGQQIIENSVTMTKMKLLKAKMENMNLSKKVTPLTFLPNTEQFVPSHSNSFKEVAKLCLIANVHYCSFSILCLVDKI